MLLRGLSALSYRAWQPCAVASFRCSFLSSSPAFFSNSDLINKVKELRRTTSAPVIDCKKALEEKGGDLEEARKWLIKKGLSQVAKLQDRVTGQGSVWVAEGKEGLAILEMNCQTDFVATNEAFKDVLAKCTSSLLQHSSSGGWTDKRAGEYTELWTADLNWLMDLPFEQSSQKVSDAVAALNYTTGEKVEISRASLLFAPQAIFGTYIHQGRIGSVVSIAKLKNDTHLAEIKTFARNLAVHVAGFHPTVIGVPSATKAQQQAHAENIDAETIGEVVADDLMSQPFSIGGSGTVGSRVLQLAQTVGQPVRVTSFVRWELGGKETAAGFR